jgi:hypothetical protein
MPRFVPYLALVALLLPAGCGHDSPPPAAPVATVPASPATSSPVSGSPAAPDGETPNGSEPAADDPPGTLACGKLGVAIQRGTLMDPGVVDDVVAASATADAPLADSAQRLAAAYAAAVAAKGAADEPDAVAAVSAAAAELAGVCNESGLETVG